MKRRRVLSKDEFSQAESRGSMLLASMMTVSFGVLIVLGMVTATLSERVSTQQIVAQANALQRAHSGVEYALWEINYSGANYSAATDGTEANWTNPVANQYEYRGLANTTVTVTDDGVADIAVASQGRSSSVNRTMSVTVPNPGGGAGVPGLFAYGLYAYGPDVTQASIYLNKNVTMDGYDSDVGVWNAATNSQAVIVRSGSTPSYNSFWASVSPETAGAIVLDGDAITKAKVKGTVQLRKKMSGETLAPNHVFDPGFVFYPEGPVETAAAKAAHGVTGLPLDILDYQDASITDQRAPYTAKDGLNPGITSLSVVSGTNRRICPGQQRAYNRINITGANLIVGCTLDTSDPYYGAGGNCGASVLNLVTGTSAACASSDPTALVTLSTGGATTAGLDGALRVWCSGVGCSTTTGAGGTATGRIVVYNPLELYYAPVTSPCVAPCVSGLRISSGGIVNRMVKGGVTNNFDPSKLAIYGGEWGTEDTSSFYTNPNLTSFYGVVFNDMSHWSFNGTDTLNFYGGMNVRQINTKTTPINFHWDADFNETSFPGTGGGGPGACAPPGDPCKPKAGTWSLTNY